MTYVDIESALRTYLADLAYCVTSTPDDLQDRLLTGGVLRIQRIGGGGDRTTRQDFPDVSIQAFKLRTSATPRAAHELAGAVRDRMEAISGVAATGGVIDSAETTSGPVEVPWPAYAVAVVQSIFGVATRGT
jgi:hypothetical protein